MDEIERKKLRMDEMDRKRLDALRKQRAKADKALAQARHLRFYDSIEIASMREVADERIAQLDRDVTLLDHLLAMIEGSDAQGTSSQKRSADLPTAT